MKLVRFGARGAEKPGIVDAQGVVRDLSSFALDWTAEFLAPKKLDTLRTLDLSRFPAAPKDARFGCPVANVGKFLAIGLNFADHAAESNMAVPDEPVVFTKATTCVGGPNDPIMKPKESQKTDWEVELGVVIGSVSRYVPIENALAHVAGFCTLNDVSERHFQLERGGSWDKGKGCDSFGPVGPWLVTTDEVGDPQNLDMWLDVNGKRMQTGNTRTMVFGVAKLVSYVSHFMTLMPGDLIATGTPPGVGLGQKPQPIYLQAGDVVKLGIEKLGEQRQDVIDWRAEG